jgi:hypothetical protein
MARVQFLAGASDFSVRHSVETSPGAPDSLLFNRHKGLFPQRVCSSRGVKMTTHLHLLPRSRIVLLYLHCPIHLRGIVFN